MQQQKQLKITFYHKVKVASHNNLERLYLSPPNFFVFIYGLPASGKTTFGKAIAQVLDYENTIAKSYPGFLEAFSSLEVI